MEETTRLRWKRSGRVRLRRLTRADLGGLYELSRRASIRLRVLEEPALDGLADLMDRAPRLQLALECDQCVVGYALASPTDRSIDEAAHPWSHTPQIASAGGWSITPDGDHLRGCGLVVCDRLEARQRTQLLTVARKGLAQEFGYEAVESVVALTDFQRHAEAMSPTAYTQQLHAGSLRDEPLSTWLDAGFVLQGYARSDQGRLVAAVRWQTRAR